MSPLFELTTPELFRLNPLSISISVPVVTRPAPESTMTFDPEVVIPNAANATGSSEEIIAKKKANLIMQCRFGLRHGLVRATLYISFAGKNAAGGGPYVGVRFQTQFSGLSS